MLRTLAETIGLTMLGCTLALAGCNEDDDGGDDAADSGDSEGSADGGSADGGSADGGSADGGSADGGSADGGSADSGSQCEGDWYLGSVPFVGDGILVACDGNPPQNCADGYYIVFNSTDECICLPQCSSFVDVSLGDPCNDSGSVVCSSIESNSGDSSGNFCVPTEWNLCGP